MDIQLEFQCNQFGKEAFDVCFNCQENPDILNLFMASLAMTDLSTGSKLVVHLTIAEGGTGWKGGRRILRTMDRRRITLEVGGA